MVSINDVLNKNKNKPKFEKTTFRPWENVFIPEHQDNSEELPERKSQNQLKLDGARNISIHQKPQEITFRKESFIGNTLSVIKYIIDKEENRDSEYIYSKSVSNTDIAGYCQTSILAVKTIITRLKKKDVLRIVHGKPGRGGFSIYSIPIKVVKVVLD